MKAPSETSSENFEAPPGKVLDAALPVPISSVSSQTSPAFTPGLDDTVARRQAIDLTQSIALYERLVDEEFNPSLTTPLSTVRYLGTPGSPELFHGTLSEILRDSLASDILPPEAITNQSMLVIIARYPDYAKDAYALLTSIGEKIALSCGVSENQDPTEKRERAARGEKSHALFFVRGSELVADLLLSMTLDAIAQGESLQNARFWQPSSRQFVSASELIATLRPDSTPLRDQTLRKWVINVSAPVHFWNALYDGLWNTPVHYWSAAYDCFDRSSSTCPYDMPDFFREVRAHLEADFRNEWTDVEQVHKIANWNCFGSHRTGYPNGQTIALALAHLLPAGPTDRVGRNPSCFEQFTEAVSFHDAPTWCEKIPLSWAAALYRVYFESQKGERINNAPFRQMLLSIERYPDDWDKDSPDFFNIVNNSDPVAQFKRREGEIEALLTKLIPATAIDDPISVLMAAKIMGIDFSEFSTERSIADSISSWSSDSAANLVSPMAPEWKEALVSVPRVKRVKESVTAISVEAIMNRRFKDLDTCTDIGIMLDHSKKPILTPEQLDFLDSPFSALLAEMNRIDRYIWKLERFTRRAGNRDELFALVELLTEVCNGGVDDDVMCVRDPIFLKDLREFLELDALVQAMRDEFSAHEASANLTDRQLEIAFRPTRGALTEFVGHLCDTCFSRVSGLAKNAPWATFVPFIKNPNAIGKDGVFPAFAGGSLAIETDAVCEDGTLARVFLIRGYNPSTSLLKGVHAATLFDEFSRYLLGIAKERGVSRILVPEDPSWGLSLTNRPYAFLDIERRFYQGDSVERMSIADPEAVALNGLVVKTGVVVGKT